MGGAEGSARVGVALLWCHFSPQGKLTGLLWQLFLVAGLRLIRSICDRVMSVTTDMGTERLIPYAKDCLRTALALFGCPLRCLPTPTRKLFPRAIHIRGWRHSWDLLLLAALCCCPFFPLWLERFKAAVSFLRDRSNMYELGRRLRAEGKHGVAEVLQKLRFINIAVWRWGTLGVNVEQMGGILDTFLANFNVAWFGTVADTRRLQLVADACRDAAFALQHKVMESFLQLAQKGMTWIGGCECHAGDDRAPCLQRGRRLQHARDFVNALTEEMLAMANTWVSAASFGGDVGLWQAAVGLFRSAALKAKNMFRYLGRLPWLLARLGMPGVKAEVLRLWSGAPAAQHHLRTREMLDPNLPGSLRHQFDLMDDDGANLHELPELHRAIEVIRKMPMDDVTNEGPHARAKRATIDSAHFGPLGRTMSICVGFSAILGSLKLAVMLGNFEINVFCFTL